MKCDPPPKRNRMHCQDHRRNGDVCSNLCVQHQAVKVKELVDLLTEADDYLNTNNLTNIGHGSILHRKMQEVIAAHKPKG